MKTVGIRELKNRLSEYVREARSGECVLVTDRGRVVAELVSPERTAGEPGVPSGLVALARSGHLTVSAGSNEASVYPKRPRLLKPRRAAQLLDEERGSR